MDPSPEVHWIQELHHWNTGAVRDDWMTAALSPIDKLHDQYSTLPDTIDARVKHFYEFFLAMYECIISVCMHTFKVHV